MHDLFDLLNPVSSSSAIAEQAVQQLPVSTLFYGWNTPWAFLKDLLFPQEEVANAALDDKAKKDIFEATQNIIKRFAELNEEFGELFKRDPTQAEGYFVWLYVEMLRRQNEITKENANFIQGRLEAFFKELDTLRQKKQQNGDALTEIYQKFRFVGKVNTGISIATGGLTLAGTAFVVATGGAALPVVLVVAKTAAAAASVWSTFVQTQTKHELEKVTAQDKQLTGERSVLNKMIENDLAGLKQAFERESMSWTQMKQLSNVLNNAIKTMIK